MCEASTIGSLLEELICIENYDFREKIFNMTIQSLQIFSGVIYVI